MAGQICLLKMWSKIVQEEMVSIVLQGPTEIPQLWNVSKFFKTTQAMTVFM